MRVIKQDKRPRPRGPIDGAFVVVTLCVIVAGLLIGSVLSGVFGELPWDTRQESSFGR